MNNPTGRKNPWRFLFLFGAVLSGGWLLLYGLLFWLADLLPVTLSHGDAASIGIIGGADGPTAIFISGVESRGFDWDVLLMGIGFLVSAGGYLLARRPRGK